MAKQREAFMEGAREKGINEKKATKIFELMEYFAGYGFNKSHSTAYALPRLPDRVPEGELPAALRRGAADHRSRRTPTSWPSTSASAAIAASRCCRPTSTRASCTSRWCPKACASGSPPSRASAKAPSSRSSRSGRAYGRITSLHQLCESLDLRLVNKRVLEALVKSGACDTLIPQGVAADRRARHALRRHRQRHRARQPHAARSRSRPGGSVRRRR